MSKELDYIREAIQKNGKKARVTVVRWQTSPTTGEQKPTKITVNANIALSVFQKPLNKRSYTWSKIRPLGVEPMNMGEITEGSLQDPMLRSKLKDVLRAEIEAELKASMGSGLDSEEIVEAPKKKKKKIEVSDEPETTPEDNTWTDPTSNDIL